MPYSVIVDWFGPYGSVAEAKAAIRANGLGEVLYVAVGSIRRQKIRRIQYVGITHDFEERLNTVHTIRRYVREEGLSLYIGNVGSQGIAGRRASHQSSRHSVLVDLAESAMAFFLELPLNIAKRCRPPRDGIVLVNRWWSADLEVRVRRRPHPDWPDLIDYDENSGDAVLRGRGRRATYLEADDIKAIGARASSEIAARRARAAKAFAQRKRRADRRSE